MGNLESTYKMEDVSVVDLSAETLSSPTIVDVIDLTKDSPRSLRPLRSRQRNAGVSSSHNTTVNLDNHHNNHNHKRHLSPMVLGSMLDNQMRHLKKKAKVSHSTSSNEILTLDDTVDEDKNTCYTVELDNKEAVALTCPICFESLSSNLYQPCCCVVRVVEECQEKSVARGARSAMKRTAAHEDGRRFVVSRVIAASVSALPRRCCDVHDARSAETRDY